MRKPSKWIEESDGYHFRDCGEYQLTYYNYSWCVIAGDQGQWEARSGNAANAEAGKAAAEAALLDLLVQVLLDLSSKEIDALERRLYRRDSLIDEVCVERLVGDE